MCKNVLEARRRWKMATNLAIDDRLISEAKEIGHHRTKKEAVTAALHEYIQRRKQLEILDLFGTIDYDPEYDYKALRRKKAP
jgi:Bacterial antitoxin of type II TA system, VapB